MEQAALERETGRLFEKLWAPYGEQQFRESVELFRRRLDRMGFDTGFFAGKTVLDAGCGGGRNTVAMACLGAERAIGIDIGADGIADARLRAKGLENARFDVASILDIPFAADSFDMVWCAGVLMITADEDRALDELTRVLRPGGFLYLLVYADEGMRWPLINTLRPLVSRIGQTAMLEIMVGSGLRENKRRTFLDDLYCPKLDFYNWPRLRRMLERRGYHEIERWPGHARLDHEHSLAEYRNDLIELQHVFQYGAMHASCDREIFGWGAQAIGAVIAAVRGFEDNVTHGRIEVREAMDCVIGQGHHRVLAQKGGSA